MTEQPDYGRTWRYSGVDQNGHEVATQEFSDTGQALDWFRERLSGDVTEMQISRSSGDAPEEYVTTLRWNESAD